MSRIINRALNFMTSQVDRIVNVICLFIGGVCVVQGSVSTGLIVFGVVCASSYAGNWLREIEKRKELLVITITSRDIIIMIVAFTILCANLIKT